MPGLNYNSVNIRISVGVKIIVWARIVARYKHGNGKY